MHDAHSAKIERPQCEIDEGLGVAQRVTAELLVLDTSSALIVCVVHVRERFTESMTESEPAINEYCRTHV